MINIGHRFIIIFPLRITSLKLWAIGKIPVFVPLHNNREIVYRRFHISTLAHNGSKIISIVKEKLGVTLEVEAHFLGHFGE